MLVLSKSFISNFILFGVGSSQFAIKNRKMGKCKLFFYSIVYGLSPVVMKIILSKLLSGNCKKLSFWLILMVWIGPH